MGTYAVTGSGSGMGYAVVGRLTAAGHTVIGVDLRDATVVADLSRPAGRRTAIGRVLERADGRLDGAVLAAGIGPTPGRDRSQLIAQVNYLGVVDLLDAWRLALAAADFLCGSVVFVDGGSDAWFRADDWPRLVPARRLRGYLQRMRSFNRPGAAS